MFIFLFLQILRFRTRPATCTILRQASIMILRRLCTTTLIQGWGNIIWLCCSDIYVPNTAIFLVFICPFCSIFITLSPRSTSTGILLQRLTSQFQEGALSTANQWPWLLQTRLSFPIQQQMLLWRWETRRCHRPPEHHQHRCRAQLQKLPRLLHQLWTRRMTRTLQKRTKKRSQEAWLQSK